MVVNYAIHMFSLQLQVYFSFMQKFIEDTAY